VSAAAPGAVVIVIVVIDSRIVVIVAVIVVAGIIIVVIVIITDPIFYSEDEFTPGPTPGTLRGNQYVVDTGMVGLPVYEAAYLG